MGAKGFVPLAAGLLLAGVCAGCSSSAASAAARCDSAVKQVAAKGDKDLPTVRDALILDACPTKAMLDQAISPYVHGRKKEVAATERDISALCDEIHSDLRICAQLLAPPPKQTTAKKLALQVPQHGKDPAVVAV